MPPARKSRQRRSESQRVAAHRRRLMQEQHYRSVSFLAHPDEFALIESARSRSGLSTKDLMLFYLSGRYLTEPLPNLLLTPAEAEIWEEPAEQEIPLEARLEAQRLRGELFRYEGRQAFVLISLYLQLERLPGLFPFEVTLIRDFAEVREALQYYLLRAAQLPPARQFLLLQRATEAELGGAVTPNPWYRVRLRLNQIYPQIAESPGESDFAAEYARMQAEYAEEI